MEFKDRVANKPNRIKLTYEDGGASTFAVIELADEPIEEGTPINAKNMNKMLNKEDNDYIIEQGRDGFWSYRKWASGIAECWGEYTSFVMPNMAWGDAHYYGKLPNVSFPESLFAMPPAVFVSASDENGGFFITRKNSTSQTVGEMFAVTIGSSEELLPIRLSFQAKGTWK